jgi:hypothetical protein
MNDLHAHPSPLAQLQSPSAILAIIQQQIQCLFGSWSMCLSGMLQDMILYEICSLIFI